MELLYFCNDKRKQTYSFEGGIFHSRTGFGALISQDSTYNSYVSG